MIGSIGLPLMTQLPLVTQITLVLATFPCHQSVPPLTIPVRPRLLALAGPLRAEVKRIADTTTNCRAIDMGISVRRASASSIEVVLSGSPIPRRTFKESLGSAR